MGACFKSQPGFQWCWAMLKPFFLICPNLHSLSLCFTKSQHAIICEVFSTPFHFQKFNNTTFFINIIFCANYISSLARHRYDYHHNISTKHWQNIKSTFSMKELSNYYYTSYIVHFESLIFWLRQPFSFKLIWEKVWSSKSAIVNSIHSREEVFLLFVKIFLWN